MRIQRLAFLLLPFGACCTAAQQSCDSPATCNQAGTAAYQAGRYDQATGAFERQLGFAEEAEDGVAEELALNNLMLAALKAGNVGMARAWMQRALARDRLGPATRFNLGKVAAAVDYAALQATPAGHYLRYAGQGGWSTLAITRQGSGYQAQFYPIRVGRGPLDEYGPAALGELSGRLDGEGPYWTLQGADLAEGCAVEVLVEGAQAKVIEQFGEHCQDYGGAGISVMGDYIKIDSRPDS